MMVYRDFVPPAIIARGCVAPAAARIGPNAVIRTAEALMAFGGKSLAAEVFAAAGIEHYLATPPASMIPESEVTALMKAMHEKLGPGRAATAGWVAGQLTGDYLLENRIPGLAQIMLRLLPASSSSPFLLKAIARHSWTFVGSGHVAFKSGNPVRIAVSGCPLCRHVASGEWSCSFYAATFERLFHKLVHDCAEVVETQCEARGDKCCLFEISWPSRVHSRPVAHRRPIQTTGMLCL
jgi:divinyl protochlorophyllide a 8-vinyl-reductase